MGLTTTLALSQKSMMPPGGHPDDDAALLEWAASYAQQVNTRWLDRSYPDLPDRELVASWQVVFHLYKHLVGWEWPDGTGPSRAHRIRFVAIQFRLRRSELVSEASNYVRHLYDEATRDDGGT
jgi:hypothetical protein